MVFLFLEKVVSGDDYISGPRVAQPRKIGDVAGALRGMATHVCVLCVDTSDKIGEAILLLVFVWDEKRVDVEISMVYLKAGFVGDPVAIPEGRSTREMIAGHIMDFTEVAA